MSSEWMPSAKSLLLILLLGAVASAGWIQFWSASNRVPISASDSKSSSEMGDLIADLKQENASLRALAQSNETLAIPQAFRERVEKELSLSFRHEVVVKKISAEALQNRISAALESLPGPHGVDDRQIAFELLGFMRQGENFMAQMTIIKSFGSLSWFDFQTGEAFVTQTLQADSIPHQAQWLKLLTLSLLHQHYPAPTSYAGDQASWAREALHHGVAAGVEARFLADSARQIGFLGTEKNPVGDQVRESLSPLVKELQQLNSVVGKGFADTLRLRGAKALHEILRNPPHSIRLIDQPDLAIAAEEAVNFQTPKSTEPPYLIESIGTLGLRVWLAAVGESAARLQTIKELKADRYVLIADDATRSSLYWDLEFVSDEGAGQFQALALLRLQKMQVGESMLKIGQSYITPEKRFISLHRLSPTRIRFVHSTHAIAD